MTGIIFGANQRVRSSADGPRSCRAAQQAGSCRWRILRWFHGLSAGGAGTAGGGVGASVDFEGPLDKAAVAGVRASGLAAVLKRGESHAGRCEDVGELMAHRYRLYPTAEQAGLMLDRHCADTRFVWNLAVEQFNWGGSGRSAPGPAQRMKQFADARQAVGWLGEGSSSVQQQALRDFDRAVAGFFARDAPTPEVAAQHVHEGFCVRDTKVRVLSRKWARCTYPSLGSCGSDCRALCRQGSWAWPASPAIRAAGGTSRSRHRNLVCPVCAGPHVRWVWIGVWPPLWRHQMALCCGRR